MLNVKIILFRVIIKTFEIIVHSNTLLNSQRYNYSKRFQSIIMKTRQVYQNLIRCVMKFEIAFFITAISKFKNEFEKDFHDHEKKNFHDHERKNFFNREMKQSLTEMLFETTNISFDFEHELNFSSITFNSFSTSFKSKKRTRQFQRNKFQFFLNLFNVYLSLHIANMTRKFDTVMNINVFSKKMKHM